ncbi:hypothetical protein FKM82_029275 [Ascaphus truei]
MFSVLCLSVCRHVQVRVSLCVCTMFVFCVARCRLFSPWFSVLCISGCRMFSVMPSLCVPPCSVFGICVRMCSVRCLLWPPCSDVLRLCVAPCQCSDRCFSLSVCSMSVFASFDSSAALFSVRSHVCRQFWVSVCAAIFSVLRLSVCRHVCVCALCVPPGLCSVAPVRVSLVGRHSVYESSRVLACARRFCVVLCCATMFSVCVLCAAHVQCVLEFSV